MKKGTGGKSNMRVYGCRNDGQCNVKAEAVERVDVEKMFVYDGHELQTQIFVSRVVDEPKVPWQNALIPC